MQKEGEIRGENVKSIVYGGLDGIITTFAIVAGVAGASLSSGVIIILGFANLIADAISMAAGEFLSTRAQQDLEEKQRDYHHNKITRHDAEEELTDMYKEKGMSEYDAKRVTAVFGKYRSVITSILLKEKHDLSASDESPFRNAYITFISFQIFGFIPLITYVLARFFPAFEHNTFLTASVLAATTMFMLGVIRGHITTTSKIKAGFETLFVGGLAASAAYGVGWLLSAIVGI